MCRKEELNAIIEQTNETNMTNYSKENLLINNLAKVMRMQEYDISFIKEDLKKFNKKLNYIIALIILVTGGGISVAEIIIKYFLK